MDPDGGNQTLIHDDTTYLYSPDWSPDGLTIIFSRGDGTTVPNQIWSVRADGMNPTQLTTTGRNDYGAWSPDGTKIVFASSRGGLWLMNPDGSGQTKVAVRGFSQPAWQPVNVTLRTSSRTVVYGQSVKLAVHLVPYVSTANQDVSLYKVPLNGSKTLVASGNVDPAGDFSFSAMPRKKTRYIAEWTGDAEHPAGGVAEVVVRVRPRVTPALRGFYAKRGRYHLYHYTARCPKDGVHCPSFKVHVAPSRAGEKIVVLLQLYYSGRWHRGLQSTRRLDDRSSLALRFVYGSTAVIGIPTRVRASIAGNEEFLAGTSRWLYFKVTS
jgi:hypothetical protein